MDRPRRSLMVALAFFAVAGLVLTLDTLWGVDVLLEGRDEAGTWQDLGTSEMGGRYGYDQPLTPLRVKANTTTPMRITLVNDRPWAFSEEVHVSLGEWPPRLIKSQRVAIDAFGRAQLEFDVNATQLPSYAPRAAWDTKTSQTFVSANLLVRWDDETVNLPLSFEVYEP